MTLFVFNEGFGHRGVWHIVDGELNFIHHDARAHRYEYEVMKYKDPYDRNPEPTGTFHISLSYWPEYIERRVPKVLCNQVKNLRCGDKAVENEKHSKTWNKPGTYITNYEFKEGNFLYESDDPPPGPMCSRCLKKRDIN